MNIDHGEEQVQINTMHLVLKEEQLNLIQIEKDSLKDINDWLEVKD